MKRDESSIRIMAGMNLEDGVLSERSQAQKATYISWVQIPVSRMDKPVEADESRLALVHPEEFGVTAWK